VLRNRARQEENSDGNARLERLLALQERQEKALREEMAGLREESALHARRGREEVQAALQCFTESVVKQFGEMARTQAEQFGRFSERLEKLVETNQGQLANLRQAVDERLQLLTKENSARLAEMQESAARGGRVQREELAQSLKELASTLLAQVAALTANTDKRLEALRLTVDERLRQVSEQNNQQLESMRQTVDEKLQSTLEKRLGESFKLVSERLELVHKGLGEMQALATGVGDLQRVLTNVKARGTWGEVQLGALLEQVLTPGQYEKNVATAGGANRVEFAIRLPGRMEDGDGIVYLPIDAKFPQEDYLRLLEAHERADAAEAENASKALEVRLRACARDIREKYVAPPATTDFGILFLPTEGLYAEVMRRNGLAEQLQREYRVLVAGPSTLWALLNSLQVGFRTLAIEKRSSEVWALLGAVKHEFGKYEKVLGNVQKKLQEASNTISSMEVRSRVMERKLRNVDAESELDLFGGEAPRLPEDI